jgi:hypothetical protein
MTVIDWLLDSDPAIRWQVLRDTWSRHRPPSWQTSDREWQQKAGAPDF